MAEMALVNDLDVTKLWTECVEEWKLIQNGSMKLDPSMANPRGFMQKFIEFDWKNPMEIEKEWFNEELMLSGTADLIIKYNGVLSIADWKTSRSYSQEKKEHYFKQLAAYAILSGKAIKALVICPLNPKNKNGYGSPIWSTDVEKYKKMYLEDLATFNEMYRK